MIIIFDHAVLEMYSSRIHENQRNQRSHWWNYFVCTVVSKVNVVSDGIISGIQNQRSYLSQ